MRINLIAESGPSAGQWVELDEGEHSVGTSAGQALELPGDPTADPHHALLVVSDDGVRVRDAGSLYGTFVNGHRITEAPLHHGDILQLGATRYRVEADEPGEGVPCPGCGLRVAADSPVCPRCGRDLAPVHEGLVAEAAPVQRFCSACGKPLPPAALFCGACGADSRQAAQPMAQPSGNVPKWVSAALVVVGVLLIFCLVGTGVAVGVLVSSRSAGRTVSALGADAAALPQPAAGALPGLPQTGTADAPQGAAPGAAAQPGAPASGQAEAGVAGEAPAPGPWHQTGRVLLRYGGRAGQVMHYKSQSVVDGGISVGGQQMPLNVNTSSGYTQEIVSNDGSHVTMRLTMEPSAVTQDGSPFSGALPTAPPPMTMTMDPSGKILNVQGASAAESTAIPGLPRELQFDYASIMRHLSAMAFPDKEVAVGESWSRECRVPLPAGGSLTFRTKSTLEGFEAVDGHDCAKVVTSMEVPIHMNLSGLPGGGTVGSVGTLSGTETTHFDPAEGALVRSHSDMALKWQMKMADQPGMKETEEALKGLGIPGATEALKLEATGQVKTTVTRDR
ncbi:MAG: FHA domain-containing protein [Armatimonadetes bacterium]|nr:FHA domain-containing protein [Armatimonadota bacterium]